MTARAIVQIDADTLRASERDLRMALDRLGEAGRRVQVRALNTTGRRTATETRRELARVKRLPQKVIKGKISHFKATLKAPTVRVWIGLKRGIPLGNIPGARYVLAGKHAGTLRAGKASAKVFRATMPNGRSGLFVRKPGSTHRRRPDGQMTELPIEQPTIRLQPEAGPILKRRATEQLRGFLPKEIRRLIDVEIEKIRARAK